LRRSNFGFRFGQLHQNRPFDQLSRRTPWRNVVHDISAAAAQACSALQGDPTQSETDLPPTANPAPTTMRSPTLSTDFSFRSTLAFAPFQPLLSVRSKPFGQPLCSQALAHSFSLFALFFAPASFVFNTLRTLRQKHPGGGTSAMSPRSLRLCVILCPSIFYSRVFISLQIPLPTSVLFSHRYKTPGVSPCPPDSWRAKPRRPRMSKGAKGKLLRDADHESQFLIAVMSCNSPAPEGRQVYGCNHEGLVWILPAVASSIARERRRGTVQALPRYDQRRTRFGMRVEAGAPEKKLLPKGRIIGRVMRQAVPESVRAQNGPQLFGTEPEGTRVQLRRVRRRPNKSMRGRLGDRARAGNFAHRRWRRLRECRRLRRHNNEESRHKRDRHCYAKR
jgi:hypothetical protein